MEKWSFNMLLFSNLTKVLDISGAEIARRVGLKQPVLNRYMTGEYVLPVQVLIQICNALRMPSGYFVSEDGECLFPNRETATLPYDDWQPVAWDNDAVELTFGDGEGRIFWKDVAEAMGVSSQKPHDRFLLRTRFPIDDFLRTCNNLDVSPFRFLVDHNDRLKSGDGKERPAESVGYEALCAEVRELTGRLADLNNTVSDITARFDDLMKRHTALLDRHNDLERTVRDYLGLDSQITMAADDSTPEP